MSSTLLTLHITTFYLNKRLAQTFSRTHHSFPSTIPSELSLSFPNTILVELPQNFFYQMCCNRPDCMDWNGSGPQVSNMWQYSHGQRRMMMKWVRFPLPLISKNGAFQDSKQSWVDFAGKLTLKKLGCASLVFQTVTFFISIRWRLKLKYNIT